MEFHNPTADLFVPDGVEPAAALARTTHLCIAAHQDDIEIMAYHGIAECFGQPGKWFTGVVVTNGAGSPRSGIYADYSDQDMQRVRVTEQRKAAYVGVEIFRMRLAAFVISAVYGGIGGTILAVTTGLADPELAYWTHSGNLVFMAVLGGSGTFAGKRESVSVSPIFTSEVVLILAIR